MSDQWNGGKGDRRRQVNYELFGIGYDMAFGKTLEIREAAKDKWLDYMSRRRRKDDNASE